MESRATYRKMKRATFFFLACLFFPGYAIAQNFGYVIGFFDEVLKVLKAGMPALVGLAFVFFLWGVVRFISTSGDSADHAERGRGMVYGLVALFILISIWGIVVLMQNMLGADGDIGSITAPEVLN